MRRVCALSLITPKRLDLLLKMGFAEGILKGDFELEELYRKHIMMRTAGVEDHKVGVDQFVSEFKDLVFSLKNNGFIESGSIEWSAPDGVNRSGAHRIAAAAVLGLEVPIYEVLGSGYEGWGVAWFKANGLEQALPYICGVYSRYFPKAGIAIQWDLGDERVSSYVRESGNCVAEFDLDLTPSDLYEFVLDVYARDTGVNSSSVIKRKAHILSKKACGIRIFLCADGGGLSDLKRRLRNDLYDDSELSYLSMHTSDSEEEYHYLAQMLFSQSYFAALSRRAQLSSQTLSWLGEFSSLVFKMGISLDNVCVVGSTVMEVYGVRASTDVDFIATSSVREEVFGEGVDGVVQLSADVDLASKGYLRLAGVDTSDDEIIALSKNHFLYRGVKMVAIEAVYERKKKQLRDKDLADIRLIDEAGVLCGVGGGGRQRRIEYYLEFYCRTLPVFLFKKAYALLRPYMPDAFISILRKVLK
jgi:hypothetical protein